MSSSHCPNCGEPVLSLVLGNNSRTNDPRGWVPEVRLLLDPEPTPKGNVIVNGERCGYVTNWDAVRYFNIPVYIRHGLTCINPLGIKKFRGLNWEPED